RRASVFRRPRARGLDVAEPARRDSHAGGAGGLLRSVAWAHANGAPAAPRSSRMHAGSQHGVGRPRPRLEELIAVVVLQAEPPSEDVSPEFGAHVNHGSQAVLRLDHGPDRPETDGLSVDRTVALVFDLESHEGRSDLSAAEKHQTVR